MFTDIKNILQKEIIPGFWARFVHAENFTIAYWEVKAGSELPEHSHFHEQSSQVMEGRLELSVNGEKRICEPGMVTIIPAHAPHSGKAVTDCKIMDVFCPAREDYK